MGSVDALFEGAAMSLVSVIASTRYATAFIRISTLLQDICIQPGIEFENEDSFPRVVNYILGCIIEHMYDEEAQKPVRVMLCHLEKKLPRRLLTVWIPQAPTTLQRILRAAVEELQHPSSVSSTTEAMKRFMFHGVQRL
jgi:hypothetical protein